MLWRINFKFTVSSFFLPSRYGWSFGLTLNYKAKHDLFNYISERLTEYNIGVVG